MFQSVLELLRLLTPRQRRQLVFLQLLVMLMSGAELLAIAALGPFMAMVGNMAIIEQDNLLADFYRSSQLGSPQLFLLWLGCLALGMMAINAIIGVVTNWRLTAFGCRVGVELGNRLYTHYMHKPWLFHTGNTSAILAKKISSDTSAVTNNIILPLLAMSARLMQAVFISVPIVLMSPALAFFGVLIFSSAYGLAYRLAQHSLNRNGMAISRAAGQRFTLISEGFGGIKDVLLTGRQRSFVDRFRAAGAEIAHSQATNQMLGIAPRYFMELLAFGLIILLVIALVRSHHGDLGQVLPRMAFYALGGLKLLAAFQGIYLGFANIRAGLPAFQAIRPDLIASYSVPQSGGDSLHIPVALGSGISLKKVCVTYPGKNIPALDEVDMEIPARKVIGIVGATGSGKSTTIDVILGLISPDSGELCVDGKPLLASQLRAWQDKLGYVPQSIFLSNASIMENIAFGLPREQIDRQRVERVIRLAHLEELVGKLPDGLDSIVGERGVQLSGGQRQRIGIARALYHDAEVLVLDEATSALDGITERFIMDAIKDFAGQKTIIMIAHRFTTVRNCDIIYLMENGSVIDRGSYDDLIERSELFRRMAQHKG